MAAIKPRFPEIKDFFVALFAGGVSLLPLLLVLLLLLLLLVLLLLLLLLFMLVKEVWELMSRLINACGHERSALQH